MKYLPTTIDAILGRSCALGSMLVSMLLVSCERVTPPSVAIPITPDATTPASTRAPPAPAIAETAGVPGSPVTASLSLDRSELRPGDILTVAVEVKIKPGWHIQAMDRPTGISPPTKLKLELPSAMAANNNWITLPPVIDSDSSSGGGYIYHAIATFRSSAKVDTDANPGLFPVRVALGYQACDRFSCRPYEVLELQTEVRIVNTRR